MCSIHGGSGDSPDVMWWSSEGTGWHTYVYKADIQFLGCVPSLEVASGINIIVSDNSGDDVWCWDAFCSLRWNKHSCSNKKEEIKRTNLVDPSSLMALLSRIKLHLLRLSHLVPADSSRLSSVCSLPAVNTACSSSWTCSLGAACTHLAPGICSPSALLSAMEPRSLPTSATAFLLILQHPASRLCVWHY